jgi:hypothetical protein
MENKLNNYKPDDFTIPHLTKKAKKQVFPGRRNVLEQIREYQILAADLFDTKDSNQSNSNSERNILQLLSEQFTIHQSEF